MIKEGNSTREKAEELIKNLQHCINDEYDVCEKCKYTPSPDCIDSLMIDVMDMLCKLLRENEYLKAENKVFKNINKDLEKDVIKLMSALDEAYGGLKN